jgi:hypothetical protein
MRPQLHKHSRWDPMNTVAAGWITGELKAPM